MTTVQKIIKFAAIALAILLIASIISGIVSVVASIFDAFDDDSYDGAHESNDVYEYEFDISEISKLDIEVEAADLTIVSGDSLSVTTDKSRVRVNQSGSTLEIDESSNWSKDECNIKITLPDGELEQVDISAGAGILSIEELRTKVLEIDLGAGESVFKAITVSESTEINGGAGNIEIKDSALSSLDFDIGVGNVEISAYVTGSSDIDCGMGALEMTLFGTSDDYTIDVNKGIGDFRVDGNSVSSGSTIGNGENRLSVDSGIGDVSIEFEKR